MLMSDSRYNDGVMNNSVENKIGKFLQRAFAGTIHNDMITFWVKFNPINGVANFFKKNVSQSRDLMFIKFHGLRQFLLSEGMKNNVHLAKRFLMVSKVTPLTFPFLYAVNLFSDSTAQARSMAGFGSFRLARISSTMRMRSMGFRRRIFFSMFLRVIKFPFLKRNVT